MMWRASGDWGVIWKDHPACHTEERSSSQRISKEATAVIWLQRQGFPGDGSERDACLTLKR